MSSILMIFKVLLVAIGALGVFLYGMKLMSDGLQKMAGNKMRSILAKMTDRPLRGILTGSFVTAVIQSSSATTVMVVSFVNAGLLSLAGAIAVIMGANIGTTITAWIISLFGLNEAGGEWMDAFTFPLFAVAISLPFLIMKKDKLRSVGEFIIGLALLLVGLQFLQSAMPTLSDYPEVLESIGHFSNWGYLSIFLFIIIGAILTCVVQSSSAMMAITLVMCFKGWINFEVAVALTMGQNIGTTITANLAAVIANSTGKKAARAHFLFNMIGVLIFLVGFYPIINLVTSLSIDIFGMDPTLVQGEESYHSESIPFALTLFHTFFNVTNTLILVWFIPQIIKLVDRMVKPANTDDEEVEVFKLKYIPSGFMHTSELDIESAHQEIQLFSKRILKMYNFLPELGTAKNDEQFASTMNHIKKYEGLTDKMEVEIAKFLTHVSETVNSKDGSKRISSMLRIIDNLESIGDSVYHLSIMYKNQREQGVSFGKNNDGHLQKMFDCVYQALEIMDNNLSKNYEDVDISLAYQAEDSINEYRNMLREAHFEAVKLGEYSYEVGTIYSSIYALYEKIGDFVINISQAIEHSQPSKPTMVANN